MSVSCSSLAFSFHPPRKLHFHEFFAGTFLIHKFFVCCFSGVRTSPRIASDPRSYGGKYPFSFLGGWMSVSCSSLAFSFHPLRKLHFHEFFAGTFLIHKFFVCCFSGVRTRPRIASDPRSYGGKYPFSFFRRMVVEVDL